MSYIKINQLRSELSYHSCQPGKMVELASIQFRTFSTWAHSLSWCALYCFALYIRNVWWQRELAPSRNLSETNYQTHMVGQWSPVTKPSRSDEVLDADEQLRIANQIKAKFDSAAPKRPMKPNRSEPDFPTPALSIVDQPYNIPELHKLRSLQSQSHVSNHCSPLVFSFSD